MSRVEKGASTKDEIQQMKGEVIKEIGASRRGRPILTCSLILFLCVAGIVGVVIWGLALSGMVQVPVVSAVVYSTPMPDHVVVAGVPVETVVDTQIKTTVTSQLQQGATQIDSFPVVVPLTEESVTASLRQLLSQTGDVTFDLARTQVEIRADETIVFFLPIEESAQQTAFQVALTLQVQDGRLELMPQWARIGHLPIPRSLVALFIQPLLTDGMVEVNDAIGSFIHLKQLEYQEGQLIVHGDAAVKILEMPSSL